MLDVAREYLYTYALTTYWSGAPHVGQGGGKHGKRGKRGKRDKHGKPSASKPSAVAD